ncbi:unnamed protein product [Dimorphilus gyrociliatus]|uniref:Uncharacterized protein n=1 Tax=Dimorphilus gyrociliatus TaxID=2664684 RepID=A0A7I8VV14_9ANNE|nr:unnamed protein product [Dimorphilus gyrociliatus]
MSSKLRDPLNNDVPSDDDLQVTKALMEGDVEVLRQECSTVIGRFKVSTAMLSGIEEALNERKEEVEAVEHQLEFYKNDLKNITNEIEELKKKKEDTKAENQGLVAMLKYAKDEQAKTLERRDSLRLSKSNMLTISDKKFRFNDEIAKNLADGEAIYCCLTDSAIQGESGRLMETMKEKEPSSRVSAVSASDRI